MEVLKDTTIPISIEFLYLLSAKAIPNLALRKIVYEKIVSHKSSLGSLDCKSITLPLILLGCFYACARNVVSLKTLVITFCSCFSALRSLIWLPHISSIRTTSDILFKWIESVVNGTLPHIAINQAKANHNFAKLIFIEESKHQNNSKPVYKDENIENSNTNSNWNKRDKLTGKCNSCHQKVYVSLMFLSKWLVGFSCFKLEMGPF